MILEGLSRLPENKKGLLFLLCLSLILKVSLAVSVHVINPDGDDYILAAQQFASGNYKAGLASGLLPFFPLLIAFFHFFVPHWVAAARVVTIASLVLTLIPLYLLTRDLLNRRAAFWACLAFTLAPFPNECATEVIRGPSFLFFFAWAIYFAQRAIRVKKPSLFVVAALFSWVSLLFRIEGIILVPFYLACLACLTLYRPRERIFFLKGIGLWLALPLFLLAGALVVLGPETASFIKIGDATQPLKKLFQLRFLESYHQIYNQLKALEALTSYPGGKQNFAEIARHFMPFVYLLGLLQSFVKVLFPLFLIPLVWGLRHPLDRSRVLVLALVVSYLFMVYYRLIERDFLQDRFLFAPAFLLFPWVGAGMARFFSFLQGTSRPRLLAALLAVLLFAPAFYKSAQPVWKQDNVINMAGEWLSKRVEFKKAGIISNDSRILFYGGRGKDFHRYNERDHDGGFAAMEQEALSKGMDLIIIRISARKKRSIPDFPHFRKIKEFLGKKNFAVIYASAEILKTLDSKDHTGTGLK